MARRWSLVVVMVGTMAFLAACSSTQTPAPVENRKVSKASPQARAPAASAAAAAPSSDPLPPAPDGFYRIRRGDTLIGISLDHGVAWRDLATWNQIDNPNLIEVDQLIRVRPPGGTKSATTASSAATKSAATEVRPLAGSSLPAAANSAPAPAATTAASKPVAEAIQLSWPSKGQVMTPFADPGYKGIAISGAEGDAVTAASDGRVVYSGNGLRGYGNLVIVKHDGDFLTAYAHNKSILVNEGQVVKRGQKIAELGKTDADVPKLHFEVRRSGKPVDPLKFLAQR